MTASCVRRLLAVSLCMVFALFVSVPRADEPTATGDLWEVVSQMSMVGLPMQMPARTVKVCAARQWTRPPGGDDAERGCTSSDMAVDEETGVVTWNSVCADGMTGTGEIIRDGDDAWTGTLRYTSEAGDLVINLTGTRIDVCDNPQ